MTHKQKLVDRLTHANPGWPEWDKLIALVQSLDFEYVVDEYTGNYFVSGNRLVFKEENKEEPIDWPGWMPGYVPALYGMNADDYECAGQYATDFDGIETGPETVFDTAGSDESDMEIPGGTYPFQSNFQGNLFHITEQLEILFPNREENCLSKLDSLEEFTKKNIRAVLEGNQWFSIYNESIGELIW
ncbi:MAG TPA: hypothetical protein VK177_21200 [Flavobacteriales bacterium]|nr:hypothetical protein [Flavobacteriales bacterium]